MALSVGRERDEEGRAALAPLSATSRSLSRSRSRSSASLLVEGTAQIAILRLLDKTYSTKLPPRPRPLQALLVLLARRPVLALAARAAPRALLALSLARLERILQVVGLGKANAVVSDPVLDDDGRVEVRERVALLLDGAELRATRRTRAPSVRART